MTDDVTHGIGEEDDASLAFLRRHPSLFVDIARVAGAVHECGLPESIAGYRVLDLLGRGGMARVVRAERDGMTFAVKLAHRETPREHDCLLREASLLCEIDHPGVVRIRDSGEEGDWAFLVMDYVDGRTLADWITAEQSVPSLRDAERVALVLGWFRDAAEALARLHVAGVVHRDIKPSNVMIGRDGSVLLIDLGLAHRRGEGQHLGRALAGTLPYMSPEQTLGGLLCVDAASDVFSLATTMFEAICLRRAVGFEARDEVLEEVAFGAPILPSRLCRQVSRRVDRVFAMAVAKDRRRRHASAVELWTDLEALLDDRRPPFAGEPVDAGIRRWLRRRPVVVGLVALMIVASLAWWSITELVRSAAREQLLTASLDALGRGDVEIAVDSLTVAITRFGDDPAVTEFSRDHAGELAPRMSMDALLSAGMVLTASRDEKRDARERASRYLLDAAPRPDFVFQVGFAMLLRDGPVAANTWLTGRDPDPFDSPLLRELRALLLVEAGDADLLASLPGIRDGDDAVIDPVAMTLRGYRAIRSAARGRTDPTFSARRSDDLVLAASSLDVAARSGVRHDFIHLCRALLAMEQREFAAAVREFEALAQRRAQDPAVALHLLLARGLAEGALPDGAIASLGSIAERVALDVESLGIWLAQCSIGFDELGSAFVWLARPIAPAQTRSLAWLGCAHDLMTAALMQRSFDLLGELGDASVAAQSGNQDEEAEHLARDLLAVGTWSGIHEVRGDLARESRDPERAVAILARTRARADRLAARFDDAGFEARAATLAADVLEAMCMPPGTDWRALGGRGADGLTDLLARSEASEVDPSDTARFLRQLVSQYRSFESKHRGG